MLTVGQAAERLGVTAKTIRRWDAIGKLPAARRDGRNRRLFDPLAVDALAQASSEGPGLSVDALAESVAAKLGAKLVQLVSAEALADVVVARLGSSLVQLVSSEVLAEGVARSVAAKLAGPRDLEPQAEDPQPLCPACHMAPKGETGLCAQCFADCEPRRRPLAAQIGENDCGYPEGPCPGCWQPFAGIGTCSDCYDVLRDAQRARQRDAQRTGP